MRFVEDRSMKALSATILGGRIGGSELMIDAFDLAPFFHVFGYELAIVGKEGGELLASLGCDCAMPVLKCRSSIALSFKGDRPHIAREVVDNIHGIQSTNFGCSQQRAAQVNKHLS